MAYLFKIPTELMTALVEIRAKTGLSLAEQVRRAVREWIDRNQRQFLLREEALKEGGERHGVIREAPKDLP